MSGFQIYVTPQGRAALVNAQHTGTAPIVIAAVGITSQPFDPETAVAVPAELKRLTTLSGTVVAEDTMHVTIRDDTADAYDLRGFGLYLADGTLFAASSQIDVILGKSGQSMLLLAMDIRFTDVDATSITFGDSSWSNPPGTESVAGVLKLSTDGQAIAGTDRATAVPPAALKAALDGRLGAGAPSTFIKGLLTKASALLVRAALELGDAATKNVGAGNGLDADTVDGKHAADFAGSSHTHQLADLGGILPIAKGGHGADTAAGARANLEAYGSAAAIAAGLSGGLSATDFDSQYSPGSRFFRGLGSSANRPEEYTAAVNLYYDDTAGAQLAVGLSTGYLYARMMTGRTWRSWNRMLHTGDIGTTGDTIPRLSGSNTWNGRQRFLGSIELPNSAWNAVGDDCFIGDHNRGGMLCVKAANSSYPPGMAFFDSGDNYLGSFSFSSSRCTFSGGLFATGGFQPGSSRELKTAFRANPYGLAAVLQLETTLGKYRKWFNPDDQERVFLIAENIAAVMPQVAAGTGIEATPPGETKPRAFPGYAIEQMLAVYAKAFQDLHEIVRAQGERIAALELSA